MKNKFTKLESDLEILRNDNNKLVEQVTRLERKCWENKQYSWREYIDISGISQSIEQIDLQKIVLNNLYNIDAPVDSQNVEACHRLKSNDNGRSNKVIAKFSKRKDMVRVINKKKSLKNTLKNLDDRGLP